ncbi:neuronal acetylcholine receptor subunit alpha-7-like isoform X1 [Vespula maculifrons]|uniref:Neuronal acetylcholine receptor subunit alpha-7-like isoform X1 n=1 Tax=Vespula maculifrons TaxID=7453 RepID=A0ABD2CH02_VESMC
MRLKGRLIQGDSCEMRSITVHPQEWNDVNMRWNISDYGGVKDLRIPPHRLWKPDVLMYNSLKKARFNNPVLPIGSSQSQSIFTNVRNIFSQR